MIMHYRSVSVVDQNCVGFEVKVAAWPHPIAAGLRRRMYFASRSVECVLLPKFVCVFKCGRDNEMEFTFGRFLFRYLASIQLDMHDDVYVSLTKKNRLNSSYRSLNATNNVIMNFKLFIFIYFSIKYTYARTCIFKGRM